jgi:ankyrin repeat protein
MNVANVLLDWRCDRGADIGLEARDENGQTALNLSMFFRGCALLSRLLQAGADPGARAPAKATPLIAAAVADDVDKAELLLVHGAPLEARNGENTALHTACSHGHIRSATVLVQHGADVNARGVHGNTPLTMARNNTDLVLLLLRAGAAPDIAGYQGWTALHICSLKNAHVAVAEQLAHGADPTMQTFGGNTPVRLALAKRHIETLRILLDAGAGPPPDGLPLADWHFLSDCQARWRAEADAALAAERVAHRATQESFRFALPHILQAACRPGPNKRPRID